MENILGKRIFGSENFEMILEADNFKKFRLWDESGEAVFECHDVFPGIQLIYYDLSMKCIKIDYSYAKDVLEINCCWGGRMECETRDDFHYMESGDFSVSKNDGCIHKIFCPFKKCRGIVIRTEISQAPKCLSCFMDDVDVKPITLKEKFCSDKNCAVFHSDKSTRHVFSELYFPPQALKKGYYKVKILELFLFLSALDVEDAKKKRCRFTKNKVELARSASEYLLENIQNKVTIADLADHLHISQTSLKNCFKDIYGVSVYTYIRAQKMHYAAALLKETDMSILEIAGNCGYDNGSKFAGSFRTVMGAAPNEYRNRISIAEMGKIVGD